MSASLVGSEMCIRDRSAGGSSLARRRGLCSSPGRGHQAGRRRARAPAPVAAAPPTARRCTARALRR
eukprot:9860811-Alexandrium_andersonii.AAC.1